LLHHARPSGRKRATETESWEGLTDGLHDAEQAASNIALLSAQQKTSPFTTNSDLAFTGDHSIAGNHHAAVVDEARVRGRERQPRGPEIAAAGEYTVDLFNAQVQPRYEHAPSFSVVRSYVDQAERAGTLTDKTLAQVRKHLDEAQVLVGDGSAGNATCLGRGGRRPVSAV
jgi:hypothetical protein